MSALSSEDHQLRTIVDKPESAFTPDRILSKQINSFQATDADIERNLAYALAKHSLCLCYYKAAVWTLVGKLHVAAQLNWGPDTTVQDDIRDRKKALEDRARRLQTEQDQVSNQHSESLSVSVEKMRESIAVLSEQRWVRQGIGGFEELCSGLGRKGSGERLVLYLCQ